MVKKVTKAKSLSQKLRNGARKILSSQSKAGKLAVTLPLTAILVEEVRAAQGFSDAQLEEFDLAQDLKKKQADLQASAITGQELTEALEDKTDFTDATQVDVGEVATVQDRPYDNDLLLAAADDVGTQASSSASSAADVQYMPVQTGVEGVSTNIVTAVPIESFELSSAILPVPFGPGAYLGAGAATVAAANTGGNAAAATTTEHTDGTHLATSLKELQALGITSVAVTGTDSLHVDFGSGASQFNTGSLPKFGDNNFDGVLSTQELNALTVTLDLSNGTQLSELATSGSGGLNALASSGIDHINLLDNAANLTADQTSLFVQSGLSFASDDVVTVGMSADVAAGTHMATSLKELQKLGVDAVNVTGAGDSGVNLDFGDGAFSASGLPTFGAAHDVTLNVIGATNLHQVGDAAASIHTAGIDHIHLSMADQATLEAAFTTGTGTLGADITALHTQGIDTTLDMLNNQLSISHTQAQLMASGDIHFASNDVVGLQVHAGGTHLASSLSDLHKLGVDAVHADTGVTAVHLDLGDETAFGSGTASLPVFDIGLDVTLHIANANDFAALSHVDLAQYNIDNLSIDYGTSLDALFVQGVDVLNDGAALAPNATYGDLLNVLGAAGLGGVSLADTTTTAVTVSDDLAAALHEAGMLHALPAANIEIDAQHASKVHGAAVLQTSLNTMAELGVDKVDLGTATTKAYVEVAFANHDDVAAMVAGFTQDTTHIGTHGLFGSGKEAGLVIEESELTAFNKFTPEQQTDLLSQLSKLGFTEIDMLNTTSNTVEMHAINTSYLILALL